MGLTSKFSEHTLEERSEILKIAGYQMDREPGYFIVYKMVRPNLYSLYKSDFQYVIGESVTEPDCNFDQQTKNAKGISAWTIPCALSYSIESSRSKNNVLLKLKIHIDDYVLIDSSHKIRCSKALVVEDCTYLIDRETYIIVNSL